MPKATKKNMYLDRPSKSRGYMSGNDVTWTGEDVNTHILKWMTDMGMMEEESDVPNSGVLSECIIACGTVGNDFILAKNRDRMYTPIVSVVRKLSKSGIEMVLMYDKRTQFVEGMNEYGIGILNSTLLNEDDSVERPGYNSRQGNIIHRALCCKTLDEAVGILSTHSGGIEGHTIIADTSRMFHVELCEGEESHVEQLDPEVFNVQTNHGIKYQKGGYSPTDGSNYVSSKLRRAMAEVELLNCETDKDIMKCLRQQAFDRDSNYNLRRTVPGEHGMFTSSQVCMNLSTLTFNFHTYGGMCDFQGIEEYVPEDYKPKIKIKLTDTQEK